MELINFKDTVFLWRDAAIRCNKKYLNLTNLYFFIFNSEVLNWQLLLEVEVFSKGD